MLITRKVLTVAHWAYWKGLVLVLSNFEEWGKIRIRICY